MNGIDKEVISEIEIKKSRFICILSPITSKEDVEEKLKQIRQDYPFARHYCYAYILLPEKKCSDDKEPAKTAGQPILNVLEKQQFNNILAIVVRYFGGIKLGAGGLVRAYTNATNQAIEKAQIYPFVSKTHVKLTFPYELEKTLLKQYPKFDVIHKTYLEMITYDGYVDPTDLETLSHLPLQLELLETIDRLKKD